MYLNYSLRPKPYIFEIIIVFIVINLFFKVIDTKNIGLGDFLLFYYDTFFISHSNRGAKLFFTTFN